MHESAWYDMCIYLFNGYKSPTTTSSGGLISPVRALLLGCPERAVSQAVCMATPERGENPAY
jgi:hypothetical protein